ncbi:MAG TPA: hypothetical protein PLJ08_07920 [Cyclobacteriaceae bacterium]|nr:hypothetical protein [Cyclobacteriaceae bacterium]
MKKLLIVIIYSYSTIQLMAQEDLRKLREGAREVKNTAREVKVATKETKAMTNEFKGNKEKDESSPAKSYIKKFWEYVEKMEAAPNDLNILGTNSRAAATAINNIKMKDKGYDVSPLETELKKWQEAYEVARNGGENQRAATNDLAALFTLLYQVKTNVAQQEIETKQVEIEDYKSKTAQLVALNIDPTDKVNAAIIGNAKSRITVDLKTIDQNIKLWETNMNMIVDERPARAYYLMIQYEHAHWDALRKGPFAEHVQLEAGYQKVTDMVNRIGSLDKVLAKGKANAAELLKNTKMPPALVQNAEMEKLFRQTFNDAGWGETIIKINLLDRDWKAIRNEITGVVEARTQRAAIASKDKTGKYTLYNYFTIQQDYLGNGYSSQAKIIYHESTGILPENIK